MTGLVTGIGWSKTFSTFGQFLRSRRAINIAKGKRAASSLHYILKLIVMSNSYSCIHHRVHTRLFPVIRHTEQVPRDTHFHDHPTLGRWCRKIHRSLFTGNRPCTHRCRSRFGLLCDSRRTAQQSSSTRICLCCNCVHLRSSQGSRSQMVHFGLTRNPYGIQRYIHLVRIAKTHFVALLITTLCYLDYWLEASRVHILKNTSRHTGW